MKRKLLALMMGMVLAVSFTACGDEVEEETVAATKAATATTAAATQAATQPAASSSTGFSLLDVTADMVTSGMYAKDDDENELVFTTFTAPSGAAMVSLFVFDADGKGDVICGQYDSNTVSVAVDENGITWTTFSITDVYTQSACTIICAEKDGMPFVANLSGQIFEGEYLNASDTITYMGTAVALMN